MIQFLGEYNCKIDDKGRLRMPAPLLKQLEGMVEEGFVLNRGFEKCLVFEAEFDELSSRMSSFLGIGSI